MKWLGRIVSQIIYGVGISFTVKYLLENVIGLSISETSLDNQAAFFWIGSFCGLSFIWMSIEFEKEWQRFLVIFCCYAIVINGAFLYLLSNNEMDIQQIMTQNIIWGVVFLCIYFSIVIYDKILARQLTKKLNEKNQ